MSDDESDTAEGALVSPELAGDAMLAAVAAGEATLARGAKSDAVLALQKALVALGAAIGPDGSFGPKTHAAIVAEQSKAHLPETGVVDGPTLGAIDRRLAEKRKKALLSAMASAVGASDSSGPAPVEQPIPSPLGPSRTDVAYFDDSSSLSGPGQGPVDDPDSPPPDAPKANAAAPLAPDRKAMFDAVFRVISEDEKAKAALSRLFSAGRLATGSLLPNLAAMAKAPRNPALILQAGIEPELLLAQTIRLVDNPLRCQQGMGRGTCGAGVMEYVLLRHDPAELVRLVDGITREASEVKLRSGRILKMPFNAIARDNSGRVDLDRMFQSAIMNHASSMSWLFDYDNPDDDDSFWAAVRGDSQVAVWGFASLYEDVMGQSYATATVFSRGKTELTELVVLHAQKGEKVPVITKYHEYHWLSVEWVERGKDGKTASIVLRNPWGFDDATGHPPRTALPEGGGRVRLTYADFEANIFGAVVRA